MNPLLAQFLSEAREILQGIGEKLIQLEETPDDLGFLKELFRLVHTLKGNSGLFDVPEMTRVLHGCEDVMAAVRNGQIAYSQDLADQLLDAADFVGLLCDSLEAGTALDPSLVSQSTLLEEALRDLLPQESTPPPPAKAPSVPLKNQEDSFPTVDDLPPAVRTVVDQRLQAKEPTYWVLYSPGEDCFFQGTDPFFLARQTPGLLWGRVVPRAPWPPLAELNLYGCALDFVALSTASQADLMQGFRYALDQVRILEVPAPVFVPKIDVTTLAARNALVAAQRQILLLNGDDAGRSGRFKAVAQVLMHCYQATGEASVVPEIEAALERALTSGQAARLLEWIDHREGRPEGAPAEERVRLGRRADDAPVDTKTLKVDQAKVDRLMNLIGEMVVSKNALPYLAQRAEDRFGVRELSREIRDQYAVIHRITEELQNAIVQVRMTPVSFIFQRFPRLVRDVSRKLGKEVHLVLEGEGTEADKSVIEALADPLVHIVRNSLDHGLETAEVRAAAGKPPAGTLRIRASQQSDRVLIEVSDDGKGIDPDVIKQVAFEKGLIDEATRDRLTPTESIQLVFAPGFSTAKVVSDLSGRGVGMDVVRTTVEDLNGSVDIESLVGKGTSIRILLPLSMAVTQVMLVESQGQLFGVPMDHVIETVRVPRRALRSIKQAQTTVLRQQIVPLKSLNSLLGLGAPPVANADDELAVLVVRVGTSTVGLLVDGFRETIDVIQKPLAGILSGLGAYSGTTLLGDGTVLMILNLRELV